MPFTGLWGGGGGRGLRIGDTFTGVDKAAAEAARDAAITGDKLERYDRDPGLVTALTYGTPAQTSYTGRSGGTWVDVTGLVTGPQGPPGDETQLIDDTAPRADRTYSSDKAEEIAAAALKYWSTDFRARLDASNFLSFERQDSPGTWVQKFKIENSALVDVIKFIEGAKPTVATGGLGLYNKKITVPGVGDTLALRIVDPEGNEYGFVVFDFTNDKIGYIKADGTWGYLPDNDDIAPLFTAASRVGDNLVLTRVNGGTVSIPLNPTYHMPSIVGFSLDIPSRITVGTDINGSHGFFFNVANAHNIQSLEIVPSEGTVGSIPIPAQDGHISGNTLLSGFDTSSPKKLTFRVQGVSTQAGATFNSNQYVVDVAAAGTEKDVYYGASSESDPGAVDLTAFTKVPYTHIGQEVAFTLLAQGGEYYYIFVPHNPGLDKIFNTTLGDIDVTTEFSTPPGGQKYENAQTVSGSGYDSYRRGPTPSAGEQDLKVRMK